MSEYIESEVVLNVPPLVDKTVGKILERFGSSGYGVEFSHEEIHKWLGVEMLPSGTRADMKKESLEYVTGICKVKDELIDNYDMCFYSVTTYGYKILHPKEQIRKGADSYFRKAQKALMRHSKMIVNIDVSELDMEDRALQSSKQNRIAFIKAAFRKRSLPQPPETTHIE